MLVIRSSSPSSFSTTADNATTIVSECKAYTKDTKDGIDNSNDNNNNNNKGTNNTSSKDKDATSHRLDNEKNNVVSSSSIPNGSPEKSTWGQIEKPGWRCNTCLAMSPFGAVKCVACEAHNPDISTSFSNAGTGFSFGNATIKASTTPSTFKSAISTTSLCSLRIGKGH